MRHSRTCWMEEGEKSSEHFCNLLKRSCEKSVFVKLKMKMQRMFLPKLILSKRFTIIFKNFTLRMMLFLTVMK